jgi:hypothetical protein
MKLEDDKPITIRKKTELCDYCAYLECSDDCNCPDCSPLQEPREKKTIPLEWCYVHKKKNCIQPLPPQPEKTDYQKRIEEILDNNTFFSERSGGVCLNRNVIKNLLSLLQEVRSEALEAQEKRIEEIIKSLEWKQPTKYHEDKEEAKICKVLEHPCKARQYEFRDLKNHYNYALKDVLSKLKEV